MPQNPNSGISSSSHVPRSGEEWLQRRRSEPLEVSSPTLTVPRFPFTRRSPTSSRLRTLQQPLDSTKPIRSFDNNSRAFPIIERRPGPNDNRLSNNIAFNKLSNAPVFSNSGKFLANRSFREGQLTFDTNTDISRNTPLTSFARSSFLIPANPHLISIDSIFPMPLPLSSTTSNVATFRFGSNKETDGIESDRIMDQFKSIFGQQSVVNLDTLQTNNVSPPSFRTSLPKISAQSLTLARPSTIISNSRSRSAKFRVPSERRNVASFRRAQPLPTAARFAFRSEIARPEARQIQGTHVLSSDSSNRILDHFKLSQRNSGRNTVLERPTSQNSLDIIHEFLRSASSRKYNNAAEFLDNNHPSLTKNIL